jgi:hypothetical protein
MANNTIPNPNDIINVQKEEKETTGFITGRGTTPQQVENAKEAKEKFTSIPSKIVNALENRQLKSFTRLAEDTLIQAAIEYQENPNSKTKASYESAYRDFIKQTNRYEKETGTVYQANSINQDIVKPVKGFDPNETNASQADTPAERAKANVVNNIPEFIKINSLDNSRWSEAFLITSEDPFAYYYTKSSNETQVPISFLADQSGAIYQQDETGDPEELQSAVVRTIRELERAGKVNEIRELLISSKVTLDASEVNAVTRAIAMPNSNVFGMDSTTKGLIERAIKTATQYNIAAVNTGGKAKFLSFTDFLKEYNGELNSKIDGGGGTPSRSVTLSKTMFTPEDLEIEIDSFFQKLTGQGADQETVELLAKRLNAMSPQKTVSNTSGSTTTSVTTGGVSAADKALAMRDMALNDPNAKQFNQATTYLQYFRDALESPIKLG